MCTVHTGGQANHHLPYGSHHCTIWSHANQQFANRRKSPKSPSQKKSLMKSPAAIDRFLLDVGRRQSKNLIKMTGFPKACAYHNLPMLQGRPLSSFKWGCNPCIWPYRTLINRVITLLITGRGPTLKVVAFKCFLCLPIVI